MLLWGRMEWRFRGASCCSGAGRSGGSEELHAALGQDGVEVQRSYLSRTTSDFISPHLGV